MVIQMKSKYWLLLIVLTLGLLYAKSCKNRNIGQVQEVDSGIQIPKVTWRPTVTIKPDSNNGDSTEDYPRSLSGSNDGRNQSGIHNIVTDARRAIVSTGTSNNIQQLEQPAVYSPISDLPTRPGNVLWSRSNGNLRYNWYGLDFGPGLSYQTNGQHRGVGVDIRWLHIGDFGTQAGIAFYKEEKASPQITLGYNLRRTKILSNVDLIVGINLQKIVSGGLRVELGQYWRK